MSTSVESILSFVRRKLEQRRGEWAAIATASGVPYHTLTKIAQGQTAAPRIDSVQRLFDYFEGRITEGA